MQITTFMAIKDALTNAPVLMSPDFTKPFEVVSDASLLGTGAVLLQEGKPIAYSSSKFILAERNYTTGEQELLGVFKALKEWRCYLEGSECTLVTDHNPIIHLQSQPNLSRRQARWMEYFARFHYNWQYRPGRINMADPLSRNPALASNYSDPASQNPALALIRLSLAAVTRGKAGTKPPPKPKPTDVVGIPAKKRQKRHVEPVVLSLYDRIIQGYVLVPWFDLPYNLKLLTKSPEGFWLSAGKIAVPHTDTLRDDIISEHHAPPLAGHIGITKVIKSLQRTFWWPNLKLSVQDFINQCHFCQTNKVTNQKAAGLLVSLPIPDANWTDISTDLIVALPVTTTGYDAILVWVCRLSKMVHLCPTTTTVSALQWAKLFIVNVVRLHGLPKSIVSDRDPRFTSHFWIEVCKMLGIKQAMSTSFHPQTDGQTERSNRTVEDMLRHYIDPSQTDWDQHLPAVEFAINNSWQESIKETPFFLNSGQHPLVPINLLDGPTVVPTATKLVNSLRERINDAKLCLQQAQQRQKALADTHRREITYVEGDMVLLNTKNIK